MSINIDVPAKYKDQVKAAMDWHRSFYTTSAMIKAGYKVHKVARPMGHRMLKGYQGVLGDLYDLDAATAEYKDEMAEWDAETEKDEEYKPKEPLSPAAFSFSVGPCESYDVTHQADKFDRTTLIKIIVAHVDVVPNTLLQKNKEELITLVEDIIKEELDCAEMDIKHHPVLELMSGCVLSTNKQWLSKADAVKMAMAHGNFCIDSQKRCVDHIAYEQIKLLQEIVDKGQSDQARGYDSIRARLHNNKVWREYNVTEEDDPNVRDVQETRKRKRQQECPHDDIEQFDGSWKCNECEERGSGDFVKKAKASN
jgi:hypothetical protein